VQVPKGEGIIIRQAIPVLAMLASGKGTPLQRFLREAKAIVFTNACRAEMNKNVQPATDKTPRKEEAKVMLLMLQQNLVILTKFHH
jgi:hypothetical protein